MTTDDEADLDPRQLVRPVERIRSTHLGDRRATFAHAVTATSRRLAAAGAGPDVKVAIATVRPHAGAVTAWACWSVGAVVVAADPGLHGAERSEVLRLGEPDIVVVDAHGLGSARARRTAPARMRSTATTICADTGAADDDPWDAVDPHPTPGRRPAPDADAAVLFGPADPARGAYYTFADLDSLGRQMLRTVDDRRWCVPGARLGTAGLARSLLLPGLTTRHAIPGSRTTPHPPGSGLLAPRATRLRPRA